MGKNTGRNISKSFSGKYSQKLLDHANQSAIDARKSSSKIVIRKTAEATGNLIGNTTVELQKFTTEYIRDENDKEIPKERYITPEERQKIINDLRLI